MTEENPQIPDADFHSPWTDPSVKDALKEGRHPDDIRLLCCQKCACYSYYNEGSHFTCSWCDWTASGSPLDDLLEAGEDISLDDYDEMMAEDVP